MQKNPKYDGYQRGLAFVVYKFSDKNSKVSGYNIEVKPSEKLGEELHKPIIRNQLLKTVFGVLI